MHAVDRLRPVVFERILPAYRDAFGAFACAWLQGSLVSGYTESADLDVMIAWDRMPEDRHALVGSFGGTFVVDHRDVHLERFHIDGQEYNVGHRELADLDADVEAVLRGSPDRGERILDPLATVAGLMHGEVVDDPADRAATIRRRLERFPDALRDELVRRCRARRDQDAPIVLRMAALDDRLSLHAFVVRMTQAALRAAFARHGVYYPGDHWVREAMQRFAIPHDVVLAYDAVFADGATPVERAEAAIGLLRVAEGVRSEPLIASLPRRGPLRAVLTQPQEERLRDVCGLGDARLELDASGWSKHVLLAGDRVFLFPRHEGFVWTVQREADALEALAAIEAVPRLVARRRDEAVSPYPFTEVARLPGVCYASLEDSLTFEQVAGFLEQAGRAIACWHEVDVATLALHLRERPAELLPLTGWAPRALDPATTGDALAEARLLVPGADPSWDRAVRGLAAVEPVVVHDDVCENNFMVDESLRLTGVLDWGAIHVGHPVRDFDFGEWGFGIFRFEDRFGELRRRMWESYRSERSVPLPDHRSLHLFWSLAETVHFARNQRTAWDRERLRRSLANVAEATEALR